MVDVSTGNIGVLQGLSDVEFDFGVSATVKETFRAEASRVSGQRGSRFLWRSTGSTDFKGHFAEVFRLNGVTQLGDLDEVVTNLRLVAAKVEELEQAAREENQRRQIAREWAQRQADRGAVSKWIDDNITGEEDPPAVTLSDSGPSASVPQPAKGVRQSPAPGAGGGGGGGGGTSSARPAKLTSFASSTGAGDLELSGSVGQLEEKCREFVTSCVWATLDASGPIQGLREWLRANGEDAEWATVVAAAFKAAGSDHAVSTLSNATVEAALRARHVAASRRDIQIDPPTGFGSQPTTGYSNDPVNTSTGNFTENESDLGFSGPAASMSWTRSYNSLSGAVGGFGRGWTSWTEVGLLVDGDAARLRLPDGREVVFPRLGTGWDRATGENLWLTGHEADYRVTNSSGMCWTLSADGRLGRLSSGPGTTVDFSYDVAGRLSSMTHERGRAVAEVGRGIGPGR